MKRFSISAIFLFIDILKKKTQNLIKIIFSIHLDRQFKVGAPQLPARIDWKSDKRGIEALSRANFGKSCSKSEEKVSLDSKKAKKCSLKGKISRVAFVVNLLAN